MKFSNTEVNGINAAIRSMRNPMNSWDKSDTKDCDYIYSECTDECPLRKTCPYIISNIIGANDMKLSQKLILAGKEHGKFLRMVQVWVDIDMPRYWWSEFDTYGFNTKSSCSTMHRLLNNQEPITKDLFITCKEDDDVFEIVINRLETLRKEYLSTKDTRLLVRAKRLLPEGFLQLRTVNTNYAEIRNIYHQRKTHRLREEWIDTFCKWVEEDLPYSKELILIGGDK